MAKAEGYDRPAWEDRFNRPTVHQLRSALNRASKRLYDRLRQYLLALDEVTEEFAWHGDCWRWTIEYRTEHADEPLAVLVPSPTDLQLAVPLDPDFIESLSMRRMKRALREGVGLAQEPFDTHWGVWSLQAEGLLEDLVDLVELKLQHQGKRVG